MGVGKFGGPSMCTWIGEAALAVLTTMDHALQAQLPDDSSMTDLPDYISSKVRHKGEMLTLNVD